MPRHLFANSFKRLAILAGLLIFVGCRETIRRAETFTDGSPRREWTLVRNHRGVFVRDGHLRTWHPGGQPESLLVYHRGVLDGDAGVWTPRGRPIFRGKYRQGYLIREQRWDSAGKLHTDRRYRIVTHRRGERPGFDSPAEKYTVLQGTGKDTVKWGSYRSWHPEGNLAAALEYREGRPHGLFREWYRNGRMKSQGFYRDGSRSGDWKFWHPTGSLKITMRFQDGKKNGSFQWWHANGNLRETATYHLDTIDGVHRAWYDSGKPRWERIYERGRLTGKARSWYTDGKPASEKSWQANRLHGPARAWDAQGTLREEVSYRNGVKDGRARLWYPDGRLLVQEYYKAGLLHGESRLWTPEGSLVVRANYAKGELTAHSAHARIRRMLEAGKQALPMEFMGYFWGMTMEEIRANTMRLGGMMASTDPANPAATLPGLGPEGQDLKLQIDLNPHGELWRVDCEWTHSLGPGLSSVAEWIENKLGFTLGIPRIHQATKSLPASLEAARSWGSFYLQSETDPPVRSLLPVVKAELMKFQGDYSVHFSLRNLLLKEYAGKAGIIISGPQYSPSEDSVSEEKASGAFRG